MIELTKKIKYWEKTDIIDSDDVLNEPIEYPVDKKVIEPEAYGWSFYSYDEDRGEAYNSIILDKMGKPTEIWFVGDNDGELPNRYPSKWNMNTLVYNDNIPIVPNIMIEELKGTQEPNNWAISLDNIRRENKGKPAISPAYDPNSPPWAPGSPAYDPNSPPWAPGSPAYDPNSPHYDPNSPHYDPNSPPYAPRSPQYTPPGSPHTPPGSPPYAPRSPQYTPPGSPHTPPGSPPHPNSRISNIHTKSTRNMERSRR